MASAEDTPGRKPGAKTKAYAKGKVYSLKLLEDPEFEKYLRAEIKARTIAPAIVVKLMEYGWGKPKEHLLIEEKDGQKAERQYSDRELTERLDQAKARLAKRVMDREASDAASTAELAKAAEPETVMH